jgi:FlaA1/EpsC-like NDP-sugar epimerase
VIPFFINKRKEGYLPITDPEMTRFNISLNDGVEMVLHALETAWGGELFVPKIPSYKIMDVANAIAPNLEKRIVGIRPGEKIHEEMITSSDSFTTYDLGKYYAILPQTTDWNLQEYIKHFNAKKVTKSFQYNSGENSDWLSIEDIRTLILKHLDENFSITSF